MMNVLGIITAATLLIFAPFTSSTSFESVLAMKPNVVGLRQAANTSNYCAGVLIAPKFVLTSSLCAPAVRTPGIKTQFAAIDSVYKSPASADGKEIEVVKWHAYPLYIAYAGWMDFMLAELKSASTVTPAPIASSNITYRGSETVGSIYGWNDGGHPTTTEEAQQMWRTVMAIQSRAQCAKTVYLCDTEYCAMGNIMDACHLNLGSPMMVAINSVDTVVGIVSNRTGCQQGDMATGFSHVKAGSDWIRKIAGI